MALHDLRHTVSTGNARHEKVGIAPHLVEAVLNHISGTKAGVELAAITTQRTVPQKRDALKRWENHVTVLAAKAFGASVTDEYMKRRAKRDRA